MTFDDGVLIIYEVMDVAPNGAKPSLVLKKYTEECFCYQTIGLSRFSFAKQQKCAAEELVAIWQDRSITTAHVCALPSGEQYNIIFVQHKKDEDENDISLLTLQKLEANYEVR